MGRAADEAARANGILSIVGNLASAKAIWMLARASRIAGLEPP
jgi:hypothetical protein